MYMYVHDSVQGEYSLVAVMECECEEAECEGEGAAGTGPWYAGM